MPDTLLTIGMVLLVLALLLLPRLMDWGIGRWRRARLLAHCHLMEVVEILQRLKGEAVASPFWHDAEDDPFSATTREKVDVAYSILCGEKGFDHYICVSVRGVTLIDSPSSWKVRLAGDLLEFCIVALGLQRAQRHDGGDFNDGGADDCLLLTREEHKAYLARRVRLPERIGSQWSYSD